MTQEQIIRAWKDPEYRSTLTEAELAALPANPAGAVEVSPEQLDGVSGGTVIFLTLIIPCPTMRGCHSSPDGGQNGPSN